MHCKDISSCYFYTHNNKYYENYKADELSRLKKYAQVSAGKDKKRDKVGIPCQKILSRKHFYFNTDTYDSKWDNWFREHILVFNRHSKNMKSTYKAKKLWKIIVQ